MQFLTVYAKARSNGSMISDLPVLINGESNGLTGRVIKLPCGIYDVSVDCLNAETRSVGLRDTTQDTPVNEIIAVDFEPEIPVDNVQQVVG